MKIYTLLFVLLIAFSNRLFAQCNGCESLCSKKYHEVAYLTSHNAYNSKENGFLFPNQKWDITTQLNSGVRALMIDVYDESDELIVYHVFKVLGTEPFIDILEEIEDFMAKNPNEVVTIILECYANSDKVAEAFKNSGLSNYLYYKDPDEEWKTLEQMILDDTRLVIFSDKDNGQARQYWYHYLWDYIVETNYNTKVIADFNCDLHRGKDNLDQKDLLILNHFLSNPTTGAGQLNKSREINSMSYLLNRAQFCQQETGKFPNFITVDFYDSGDCWEVVDILNETTHTCPKDYNNISVYPNPGREFVYIEGEHPIVEKLRVFSMHGQDMTNQVSMIKRNHSLIQVDVSNLAVGMYVIRSIFFEAKFLKYNY